MREKEVLSRVGDFASTLVFGPRTQGTIVEIYCQRDIDQHKYWHVLVEKPDSTRTQFTLADGTVYGKAAIGKSKTSFVRGGCFDLRMRGRSEVTPLTSGISKDPFNLNPS